MRSHSREVLVVAIEDVTGTAFVVAEYRAEENREPAPLYSDSVVGLLLNAASRRAAGELPRTVRGRPAASPAFEHDSICTLES
jgi:hypothetical protein